MNPYPLPGKKTSGSMAFCLGTKVLRRIVLGTTDVVLGMADVVLGTTDRPTDRG